MKSVPEAEGGSAKGKPIGRRVVLGMAGIGALGVVFGAPVDGWVADVLQPLSSGSGSGIADLIPGSDYFQLYTVTSGFPEVPHDYHLVLDGLVDKPLSLTVSDLEAMPPTKLVRDFQCVTGWRVPGVHWTGVKLAYLLDQAGVAPEGKAVFFESFDGVYTESLTMAQATLPDVIIAYQMLGGPVTRPHGGPVRLYIPEMYGYKSIKWLSKISVVAVEGSGYWEQYGYDLNAWIGRSNGRDDTPVS
jgi:DMSO/TMAO reductase YedYZ molybdopterin-dependent catalytic subunit